MKTIEHFMSLLGSRDIVLRADGDRLRVNAPKGAMTPDLAVQIKTRKQEILDFMKRLQTEEAPILRAPRDSDPPLSFAQQRMWFLDQLEGGDGDSATAGSHYNIPTALRLLGPLDRMGLIWAISEIQRRHEVLRTLFPSAEGEPRIQVQAIDSIVVPVLDLRGLKDAGRSAQTLAVREVAGPFDLAKGPLLRLNLMVLGPEEHWVTVTMHHIVSDGWSCGVLVGEIIRFYAHYVVHGRGGRLPVPPLEIQYADFARWQRGWLTDDRLDRQVSYWKKQLADFPSLHQIPTDRPRPRMLSYRGAGEAFTIEAGPAQALRTLAKTAGASLFMVLEAAFALLIHRYSGMEDCCIGTPVANRNRKQLEPLIGLFVNTLVLRNDLSGDPPFLDFLQRVKTIALAAYQHQDIPFEQVVDALQPERNLSYSPIFQIMFTMANTPKVALELPGLVLAPVHLGLDMAKFDLNLSMDEADELLACALEYNTDLWDGPTIRRMIGHLRHLLESIAAQPRRRLSRQSLLDDAERERMLVTWNATERPFPGECCIHQLFEAQAARTPDAPALTEGTRSFSYRELDQWAERIAATLRCEGVGPWVRVGLIVSRSAEMIAGIYGILKAGGAYVPVDPNYPRERIAFMLEDAAAPVLLTTRKDRENLPQTATGVFLLDEALPEVGHAPRPVPSDPDHLIYIIYTSGSTGRPKGAGVFHRGFVNLVHWFVTDFSLSERDSVLMTSSVSFDLTQKNMYAPLIVGGSLHLAPPSPYDPRLITELVAEHEVSWLNCTPSAFYSLIEDGGADHESRLASLRWVFLGGEPISIARLQSWLGDAHCDAVVVNTYGPTECTDISNFNPMTAPLDYLNKATPIGKPVYNVKLLILDGRLGLVPFGGMGELCIFGASVGPGYLTDPGLTARKFLPNPYSTIPGDRLYRSGDLVSYPTRNGAVDAHIEFIGRIDHQIKIRGFRIELGEIEAALAKLHSVREAVAIVAEAVSQDKRLLAFVRMDEGVEAPDFLEPLRESLPDYMIPNFVQVLDAFPLTPSGKIDRIALQHLAGEAIGNEHVAGFVAPADPMETRVAAVFAEVLKREKLSVTDSFFRLGGHSLLATRVISRLRTALGVDLPLRLIFEQPNVRGLSKKLRAHLSSTGTSKAPALVPIPGRNAPDAESLPLSFSQERLWFLYQLEGPSATYNMPTAVQLEGTLAVEILAESAAGVLRRHEILRTCFPTEGDLVWQAVMPPGAVALPLVDLIGVAEAERRDWAGALVERASLMPFLLETGPLLRLLLLRTGSRSHILLVNMHHIVSDGWSLSIFTGELVEIYRSRVASSAQKKIARLSELPIQYGDFADWQRQWLRGEVLERQIQYWRRQLGDEPPALALPTDYVRPAVRGFRGDSRELRLTAAVTACLENLARAEDATLFMTLLSAFYLLLGRWSGQSDICVGTPIAGRNRDETEPLIGFFLNTLVLRADLSAEDCGGPTFRELLARVRALTFDAYNHQDVPFEKLLEVLNPERDLSRTPLFQVFFNMLNLPEPASEAGGLTMKLHETAEIGAKFDLTLYVAEPPDGLRFHLHYNADLFQADRMAAFMTQFGHLLALVAENPRRPIAAYSLVTAAAAQVLPDPNLSLDAGWRGSVHELFSREVRLAPQRIAVSGGTVSLSYAELETESNRIASWLMGHGVGRGGFVAVYGARHPSLVVAIYGILKSGAAFVMLDPAYPAARQRHYLATVNPSAWLGLEAAGALPPELESAISEIPRLVLPGGARAPELPAMTAEVPAAAVGPDDIAYVVFTSGSTGDPKGIAGRHGPLTHFLPWLQRVFAFSERDRFSMLSGLAHDPLQRDIFTPLSLGAALCIPTPDDIGPGLLAHWMARMAVSVSHLTPAMARIMTELAAGDERPAPRLAFVTGDVLTRRDVARLRAMSAAIRVVNFYGATETQRAVGYQEASRAIAPGATDTRVAGPPAAGSPAAGTPSHGDKEVLPLGRGIEDVQLLVVNPAGARAGVGEIGEIYMRSPHLAAGYLNAPELTRSRFLVNSLADGDQPADRVYRTGDLGYIRPDGMVVFAGRADRQVKVRGYRIELGEIEGVLALHPLVVEAVVLAETHEREDTRLLAFVQVGDQAETGFQTAIRNHLKQNLPAFMMPAAIFPLASLPLTPNGKIDRAALQRLGREGLAAGAGWRGNGRPESGTFTAPRRPAEEVLRAIWAEVLGKTQSSLSIHTDFFDLGGHSLLATGVIARIRDAFGLALPLRTMFEATTIAALAERIETLRHNTSGEPPIVALARGGEPLPLSFSQQRLWFLDRLEGANPAYNMAFALRLQGLLQPEALARCLTEIVRRHEVLRTNFSDRDGEARLVIREAVPLDLLVLDLSDCVDPQMEVPRHATAEAALPFDLEKDALFRVRLLRMEAEAHVLLVTMHHIVSDGWSLGIMVRELCALYEMASGHGEVPLPGLTVQYADYAAWQRAWLAGEVREQQLDYWKTRLAGTVPLLELATDRPRPATQSFNGGRLSFTLDAALSRALSALVRQRGATLFMVLEAVYAVLLSRYSAADDIPIGTPVANRTRAAFEPLIGFFANTLVLRNNLSGDPSFEALLDSVRHTALDAYAYQDVPFEQVIDALQPERNLGFSPLFQVMFVFQNLPAGAADLSALKVTPLATEHVFAKFDLTLTMSESNLSGGGLNGEFEFNRDLFETETVRRMSGHFQNLLAAVTADPGKRVSRLSMLNKLEKNELIVNWCHGLTASAMSNGSFVHRLFEARATANPDAAALVGQHGERLSYRRLDQRADGLAARLAGMGVGPETFAGVLAARTPEMVIAMLAVLKAGGAYVPLDPDYPAERLSFMLHDTDLTVLITFGEAASSLPQTTVPVVNLDEIDDVPATTPTPSLHAEHLSHLIYTSGSTGRPKGVAIRHRNTAALMAWAHRVFDDGDLQSVLAATSICFDLSMFEIFAPLGRGGRVVIAENALALPTHPARHEVTLVNTVPSAMAELVRNAALPASPAVVNLAGEVLRRDLVDALLARPGLKAVYNLYGPSEDTTYSTVARMRQGDHLGPAIGRPVDGTGVYVLGKALELLPAGVPGELFLAGEGLARGYLKRPDLTAERFIPNPFTDTAGDSGSAGAGDRLYRSGDRVRFRTDGELEFLGRFDHQIKLRGFRIELGEIESLLMRHERVDEAVVLVAGSRLTAFIESSVDGFPNELPEFLARQLPDHMIPASWVVLAALPRTPNGKIDRRTLTRKIPVPGSVRKTAFTPPGTRKERLLHDVWAAVLGKSKAEVGIDDNFFEIGGDSILSIRIVSRARQEGLFFTPKQMFRYQTVRRLAAVAQTAKARVIDAEQGPVTGTVPLTPIQHWYLDQHLPNPSHFNQAMLFSLPEHIDPNLMQAAFDALLQHHDALRLRFHREDGSWRQAFAGNTWFELALHHLQTASDPVRALETHAAEIQQSLNIETGPTIRAALFSGCPDLGGDRSTRLLIAIHHLVVDGVSWRILLEDLQTAYEALSRGRTVKLPPKTTSYKAWSERLVRFAAEDALEQEAAWWRECLAAPVEALPIAEEANGAANLHGAAESHVMSLDETRTRALIGEVHRAYRTGVEDLLLTALLEAASGLFGTRSLLVDLEGHGREALFDDTDLSRTVGWFTALYPVNMRLAALPGPAANLKSVKETLRRVPNKGVGYGMLRYLKGDIGDGRRAEILFNYLGQAGETGATLVGEAPESVGPRRAPDGPRAHLIEINALVAGGKLRLDWTFSPVCHRPATIEALAARFQDRLAALIDHCLEPRTRGYTPSDFPLAGLDQPALDRLTAPFQAVEDLYPLGPMQEGMLYHALSQAGSGIYFEQLVVTLAGLHDTTAFKHAWEHAISRHQVLRASFHWQHLTRPLQLVHGQVSMPWREEDWRGEPEAVLRARFEALLREEQQRDFPLERAPLLRATLVRLGQDRYRFMWNYHHLLMDGWSAPLLFREVLACYQSFTRDETPRLAPVRPYRDYIAWLEARDRREAERFWRGALKGFNRPTPLPDARPRTGEATGESRALELALSEEETSRLERFVRERRVTQNTVIQAVWSLLLGAYSGMNDVLFGAVVSGRTPELEGVDAMVGLFINTLPVRVRIDTTPMADWLAALHAQQAERERFAHTPLVEIQGGGEVPRGVSLFESLLVFENYPVDPAAAGAAENTLVIERASQVERTHYPLVLVAVPGRVLHLKLGFDADCFEEETMDRLLTRVHVLLQQLVGGKARTPEALIDGLGFSPRLAEAENEIPPGNTNLTENQFLIWMGQRLEADDRSYHNVLCISIDDSLIKSHFETAFRTVVRASDALRSTFVERDGLPHCEIRDDLDVSLDYFDFSAAARSQQAFRDWVSHRLQQPLDLGERVFDSALCKLGEQHFVWYLNIHQIAADGEAFAAIFSQTEALYRDAVEGKTPRPPDATPFADYLASEKQYRDSERHRRDVAFWQQKLEAGDQPLDFYGRTGETAVAPMETIVRHLTRDSVAALDEALSGDHRQATPAAARFQFFLTALTIYLHKITGNRTITIGIPIHNRRGKVFKKTIGSFMHALPLRVAIDPAESVRSLNERLASLSFECMRYGQAVIRNPRRKPVYQAMLNYHLAKYPPFAGAPVAVDWVHMPTGTMPFTLQLNDFEGGGGLKLEFELHQKSFDAPIRPWVPEHFLRVFQACLENSNRSVSQISGLTAQEKKRLLHEFNAVQLPLAETMTVLDLMERATGRGPDRNAVIARGEFLSYGELNARAEVLAGQLREAGVGPESRVGLCFEREAYLIIAVLAVLKAGGAYVPLAPDYPEDRLHFMIADARLALILCHQRFLGQLTEGEARVYCLDETGCLPGHDHGACSLGPACRPLNAAYIIYTSGSTGKPKGVVVGHRAWYNAFLAWEADFEIKPFDSAHLQLASFSFDVFSGDLVRALCSGGTLALVPKPVLLVAESLARLIWETRVTHVDSSPAVMRNLADYLEDRGEMLTSLQLMAIGGDSWFISDYRRIRKLLPSHARLVNSYGVSEATVDSSFYHGDTAGRAEENTVPIGWPFANSTLYVLDSGMRPVVTGVAAELFIGGEGLARGYLDRPDLTGARFVPNPFAGEGQSGSRLYRTGDLVRHFPDDGRSGIEFIGRVDFQVKIRGFRVETGEIEAILCRSPLVAAAIVLVRERALGGDATEKILVAYLRLHRDMETETMEKALLEHLRQTLPTYMVPAVFEVVAQFPLTPNGKIDREALATRPLTKRRQVTDNPRNINELRMLALWEEVLGNVAVGIHDAFFDLGGHSLMAVRLVARIRETFHVAVGIADLFANPCVAALSQLVGSRDAKAGWSHLVALRAEGEKNPFFCIHAAGGQVMSYLPLMRHLDRNRPFYALQALGSEEGQEPFQDIETMARRYVAEIRALRPEGPYLLGGWSMGGTIAFEMAQQLVGAGLEVGRLVLIDSIPFNQMNLSENYGEAEVMASFVSQIAPVVLDAITPEILRPIAAAERLAFIHDQAEAAGVLPSDAEMRQLRQQWQLFRANALASYHYRAKPWPGRITLLRAQERDARFRDDPANGWGDLATAVEVHAVEGDHMSMVREPHVRVMAQLLDTCLDRTALIGLVTGAPNGRPGSTG